MNPVKVCCPAEAVWPSGPPVSRAVFQDSQQHGLQELSSLPVAIFRNSAAFLANLTWSCIWVLSAQQRALLRMLAIDTCGPISFLYKCGILVGQSGGGADSFASSQKEEWLGPSWRGRSCGLASDSAPELGLALGRYSRSFSETSVTGATSNFPVRCLLDSWNHSSKHGNKEEEEHLIVKLGTNHGRLTSEGGQGA